jgi:hypothetical protein
MSTKITTIYGEKYHLYKECFEDEGFYLQLDGDNLEFEVFPKMITVRIPNEVIEAILNNSDKIKEEIKNDGSWRDFSEDFND